MCPPPETEHQLLSRVPLSLRPLSSGVDSLLIKAVPSPEHVLTAQPQEDRRLPPPQAWCLQRPPLGGRKEDVSIQVPRTVSTTKAEMPACTAKREPTAFPGLEGAGRPRNGIADSSWGAPHWHLGVKKERAGPRTEEPPCPPRGTEFCGRNGWGGAQRASILQRAGKGKAGKGPQRGLQPQAPKCPRTARLQLTGH